MLTQSRLKELLHYCAETGVFTWIAKPNRNIVIGSIAGAIHSHGYIHVNVDGKRYYAHRLAWFYVNGCWPKFEIDHINLDKKDNRIVNLRDITHGENLHNLRSPQRNNKTSNLIGASFHSGAGKFVASIGLKGKTKYLGLFETAELAHQAYLNAKKIYHPSSTTRLEQMAELMGDV
jgi:hypothetical protein